MEKMISSLRGQRVFNIAHASDVSAARRYGTQLADSLGFNETESGKLAIIISELATNIVKHAESGSVSVTPFQHDEMDSIRVVAIDKGPGIADLAHSMRDGISTTGTAGNGLGAIKRLSHAFDVYSVLGKGSAFYACLHAKKGAGTPSSDGGGKGMQVEYGAVCIPVAGEEECGDAWAIVRDDDAITILVADGLGHGPEAAMASAEAVRALEGRGKAAPTVLIQAMHHALRITRGAALAIGQCRFSSGSLNFVGIGNISACLVENGKRKQLASHNGIVGHNMRKVQDFTIPWPEGALYIMCSDGIATQWDLNFYPGLISCHPALIAAVIYRDFTRLRDDATIVVFRKNHH